MDFLDRPLSLDLFYVMFTFVHLKNKAWVSFRDIGKSYFSLYLDSFKLFKDHFASIVAMNPGFQEEVVKVSAGGGPLLSPTYLFSFPS